MLVYLELKTPLGNFHCEPIEVNDEQYLKILEYSKTFHHSEMFDSLLQNNEANEAADAREEIIENNSQMSKSATASPQSSATLIASNPNPVIAKNSKPPVTTLAVIERKLNEIDPKIDEVTAINEIIKSFIIEKKRKIYGGFALNLLLTAKDKSLALYDAFDNPDIDFYSPEPLNDLKELCDRIYDAGFKQVIGQEAQHKETYSIYVNYQLYCDISYMPNNIYKKTRFINTNGFTLIHPWFAMIDYFRMFTDPMVSYWRLEKHYERYMLLQKTYPLPLITESLYFDAFKDKGVNEVMNLINNRPSQND
jgi:hypothetical protein